MASVLQQHAVPCGVQVQHMRLQLGLKAVEARLSKRLLVPISVRVEEEILIRREGFFLEVALFGSSEQICCPSF